MKKKNFKLKSFLSATLAILISATAFGGVKLSQVPVSAEDTSALPTDRAYYSFESGKQEYLDIAADYNTEKAEVSVATEEDGNNYLRFKYQRYKNGYINFPFELENGKTYKISYKVKPDSGTYETTPEKSKVNWLHEKQGYAGIYAGKSTGKTTLEADPDNKGTNRIGIDNYKSGVGTRLASLTGLDGDYAKMTNWTDWKTVESTFTVPDGTVTEDYKYLSFCYFGANGVVGDGKGEDNYYTICFDDIYIKEVSSDKATYNFEYEREYLDVAADYNTQKAELSVAKEEDGNHYLKFKYQRYKNGYINFPFELKSGKTYKLSYKLKPDSGNYESGNAKVDLLHDKQGYAGIYVGKATGKTTLTAGTANRIGIGTYKEGVTTRLASLTQLPGNDGNGTYANMSNWKDWQTIESTFTVPDGAVTEDNKYLSFCYFSANSQIGDSESEDNYYTICFDDIHIEEVTQQAGDIVFDGVIDDKDLAEMKLILLGITTDYKFEIANVNSDDNEINILDLVSLNEMVKKN